ncbi:unnamed protein product (macronuclear) [Paramecium tetraurelia]|uniref:Uncharacterized protein n=1 Tax=Paramecium tetraurelia TaxID=5888 RepID=A0D0D8_PARTE|nr:uncharacterized protein GSPATT00012057001 [Paramecium tetraurelia]CAK76505.1 unnamed protein product [Paramecium tetraurelia]|eukprot:XP_001443902.1 hypothetical protein (macronuclear) [Paramecium tetraurelia strain d4-2]
MITFAQRWPLVQFISLKIRRLFISITYYIKALQNFCEIASAIFAEHQQQYKIYMEPALHNQASIQNVYQLLHMNSNFYQDLTSKRVKERSIGDAYDRVQQWRYYFRNGIQENGILKKVTLKEAADLVQVPKKTLEDYIQIFNKAALIINIQEITEKKMGYLRSYMKKNKSKIRKAMIQQKQQKFEENLKKQNQEVYENTKSNKNEDESITSPYPYQQNILSEICDDQNDWEQYSNNIFKIFPNPHFD